MPQPNSPTRANITRLALFALVGWALVALSRRHPGLDTAEETVARPAVDLFEETQAAETRSTRPRVRSRQRRLATSLA
jgi:hypothetical protein